MLANDYLNLHKSLVLKKYEQHQDNINPYVSLFFCDNWKWMNSHLIHYGSQKIRPTKSKSSLKTDIITCVRMYPDCSADFCFQKYKYEKLTRQDKIAILTITNTEFLTLFLELYGNCKGKNLHQQINLTLAQHLPLELPSDRSTFSYFQKLIKNAKIACLAQPLMYFTDGQLVSELLNWLQQISHHKIFQMAHKITDNDHPEENILWFHSQSFHSWQAWLANEFQKVIIKNYLNRSMDYERLNQFKKYLRDNGNTAKLKYLEMPLSNFKTNQITCSQYQNEIKVFQKQFYEYLSNKILNDLSKTQKKKKNRKKPKKRTNSQFNQQQEQIKNKEKNKQQQIQKQIQLEIQQINIQQKQLEIIQYEQNKNEQDINSCIKQYSSDLNLQNISNDSLTSFKSNKNISNQIQQEKQQFRSAKFEKQSSQIQQINYLKTISTFENHAESEIEQRQLISNQNINLDKNKHKVRKRGPKRQQNIIFRQLRSKIFRTLINHEFNNFIDNLSIATNNFYDYRVISFQRIRYFVRNIFPHAEAILFGSNAVGLSLPSSDIDIMLINMPCYYKQQASQMLAQIAIEINVMGWIVSCSTYLNAKVPIIKLEVDTNVSYMHMKRKSDLFGTIDPCLLSYLDLKFGKNGRNVKVDITISLEGTKNIGSQSTQLMRSWMSKYPQMQRLILAFKYILANKGYNENFKGGIGSYCLFVMIAAYYKQYLCTNEQQGDIFVQVLKFYGQIFQNQLKSITLKSEGSCFISLHQSLSKSDINPEILCSNLLRIVDPLNNRIMSSSCYQYNSIKNEFRRIHSQISNVQETIQKQLILNYTVNQAKKMLVQKKSLQKWVHKYKSRTRFNLKSIIDGK